MVHYTWQLKSRVSIPGRSKILSFPQKCTDHALGSILSPIKWVPGDTWLPEKRTINYFTHMPVDTQDGNTINGVFKPTWQAQRDSQRLNGITYSKGSHEYTTVSLCTVRYVVVTPFNWQQCSFYVFIQMATLCHFKHKYGTRFTAWAGTANSYGLGGPGIESPWKRDLPHPSRSALGPSQPPI